MEQLLKKIQKLSSKEINDELNQLSESDKIIFYTYYLDVCNKKRSQELENFDDIEILKILDIILKEKNIGIIINDFILLPSTKDIFSVKIYNFLKNIKLSFRDFFLLLKNKNIDFLIIKKIFNGSLINKIENTYTEEEKKDIINLMNEKNIYLFDVHIKNDFLKNIGYYNYLFYIKNDDNYLEEFNFLLDNFYIIKEDEDIKTIICKLFFSTPEGFVVKIALPKDIKRDLFITFVEKYYNQYLLFKKDYYKYLDLKKEKEYYDSFFEHLDCEITIENF